MGEITKHQELGTGYRSRQQKKKKHKQSTFVLFFPFFKASGPDISRLNSQSRLIAHVTPRLGLYEPPRLWGTRIKPLPGCSSTSLLVPTRPQGCVVPPARPPRTLPASLRGRCPVGYQNDSDPENAAGFCLLVNQIFCVISLYYKVDIGERVLEEKLSPGSSPGAAPSRHSRRSVPAICRDTRKQPLVCLPITIIIIAAPGAAAAPSALPGQAGSPGTGHPPLRSLLAIS